MKDLLANRIREYLRGRKTPATTAEVNQAVSSTNASRVLRELHAQRFVARGLRRLASGHDTFTWSPR